MEPARAGGAGGGGRLRTPWHACIPYHLPDGILTPRAPSAALTDRRAAPQVLASMVVGDVRYWLAGRRAGPPDRHHLQHRERCHDCCGWTASGSLHGGHVPNAPPSPTTVPLAAAVGLDGSLDQR